ncbi:hypothetical protein LJC60_04160 [Ruminococcaceae bacterium OttesenSCG-928-D13]|nr:hypothetical protein [Ruminococcaceae bacterium OttesenSCG-928-D13]
MDKYKKTLIKIAAIALALLVLCAGAIAAIDPFFHYHAPLEGLAYTIDSETRFYYTPGLARHSSYDSILVGSSVAAAFKPQAFAEHMGLNTHLATVDASYPKNHALVTEIALESDNDVNTVFIVLDLQYLGMPADQYHDGDIPLYLYDDDPFNDTQYLLNKQVLFTYAGGVLLKTAQGGSTPSVENAFGRPWDVIFKEVRTLQSYEEQMTVPGSLLDFSGVDGVQNARRNLDENLAPLVQAYPEVSFKFIFPPISMAYLYGLMQKGYFNTALEELAAVIEGLLGLPNAEAYFFLGMEEVVANLYHYADVVHFPDPVGERLVALMAQGKYRLTKENWRAKLDDFAALVQNFNYEVYFGGDSVPTKLADDLPALVDALAENLDRYVVLAGSNCSGAFEVPAVVREQLGRIGLMRELPAGEAQSYIAVLDGADVVLEQVGGDDVAMVAVDGLPCALDAAGTGYLSIGGVDYSIYGTGFNLVVYDKLQGCVVDSVAVQCAAMPKISRSLFAFG